MIVLLSDWCAHCALLGPRLRCHMRDGEEEMLFGMERSECQASGFSSCFKANARECEEQGREETTTSE